MIGISLNKGDLFAVPLEANSFGAGVVAGKWMEELYLVIFKERFGDLEAVRTANVRELSPLLASSSLDAKLWHGHWPVVRHGVGTRWIMQPIYKIEEPGGLRAESFDREFRKVVWPGISDIVKFLRPCDWKKHSSHITVLAIGTWHLMKHFSLTWNWRIGRAPCPLRIWALHPIAPDRPGCELGARATKALAAHPVWVAREVAGRPSVICTMR